MSKIFYDHLIKIEEVTTELDGYEMTIEEKDEIISIIDETFHNRTIDVILSNLPKEHHETFLTMLHDSPHRPELLDFLKEKSTKDIEEEIKKAAEITKKEILTEIKKSKLKNR
jgi:hypothetical protein